MSKKKVTPETLAVWLTRQNGCSQCYHAWLKEPRKLKRGVYKGHWDFSGVNVYLCPEKVHRHFPKAFHLPPGGGPLECVLTVKHEH